MPWARIKLKDLQSIEMFGHRILDENDEFMLVEFSDTREEYVIDKKDPYVWFEDEVDAMQMGAEGIMHGPNR